MSREFYRRDYEPQRLSRRDSDGDVRQKQSRGTSRNRSDSRPSVSRRTTSEWQTLSTTGENLHSEPSADPRIRNNSKTTAFGTETTYTSSLPTLSVVDKSAAAAAIPASLDESNNTVSDARAQVGVRVPADIATNAPASLMSPVDSIASLLISFTKEAYSAAYSKLREDGAKERLAKAEKIDRQNRRIASAYGDFAAYTEQGEENLKTAAKLLDEARKSKQEAETRSSAAAIAAATHIVELMKGNNDVRAAVAATTQERSEVKQQVQQTKATLTTVTQELSEVRKEVQQARAGAQIMSKKVDALTDSQKRELKGLSSEFAEIHRRHNDLRTDVDDLRNECRPIIHDLKFFNSDLTELRRHNERFNGLKGELGDSRKESNAIVQELKTLQTAVHTLETSQKENKATLQDLENLQVEVFNLEKRRKESNATVQDLKSLQTIVNELSTKLSNMVQRPDFVRLSSMVESVSKQQTASRGVDEAHRSLQRMLEPELTTIKADTKSVQKLVENMLSERSAKENFVADRFHSIEQTIKQVRTDIDKQVAATPNPDQQDTSEVLQALSSLHKEFALLKTESRDSKQAITNALPGLRTAIDGNKANTHSIRALTQRWNNINTEDMVNAMLRQLERLYPHASQQQASFDALRKNLDTIRTQCHDSHKALEHRVSDTFANATQEIKAITAEAKKNDAEHREHWTQVIEGVKSQRDALKSEITHDIKTLKESHAAELASLQARIDKWKATSAADINGIAHDEETSDSDEQVSRIPRARNPFETKVKGVRTDKKRKRVVLLESPDFIELEEREGSAPLRVKAARKR